MADWQDKISCFSPNYVTHEVGDVPVNFYPVSVGLMFELRTIARPLAKSLAFLFNKQDHDQGTRNVTLQREDGMADNEISIEPITEGLAKVRFEQRANAIEELVTSLTEPEHLAVVGKIIMNSMREVFPPGDKENPPPGEFINQLMTPAITGCLIGVGKANKGVLGPLADQVGETMTASLARIAAQSGTQEDEPDLKLTPTTEETAPTAG